jgi:hypothetical protein
LRTRTRWSVFFDVAMPVSTEGLLSTTERSQALVVVASLQAMLQAALVAANHVGNIRLQCLLRFPRVRVRRIAKPPNSVEALRVQPLLSALMSRFVLVTNNKLDHPSTLSLSINQRGWG